MNNINIVYFEYKLYNFLGVFLYLPYPKVFLHIPIPQHPE